MIVGIENFQSIEKAVLSLTGLSVIVGPSNYGKSAVLRAIEGALFNRPGEHIVRKGAKNASVSITGLPSVSMVVWTKGTANKYQIGGLDFSRVGSGAPQPLQDAGFRDVWIGDAASKKGESIRPQVGEQFDPLFLLTRSPGFIADVLGLMSRHHVVATAQDRCASDLRAAKQRLGIRRGDLVAVDEKLMVLAVAPVISDGHRRALQNTISLEVNTLTSLRALREKRALVLTVPKPGPMFAGRSEDIKEALRVGAGLAEADVLFNRRQFLQAIPALPERPKFGVVVTAPVKLRPLLDRKRLLAQVTAPSFKPFATVITRKVDQLRPLVEARREALDTLFLTQQAARASEDERTAAVIELDTLTEGRACPTCGQPMRTVGV